MSTSQTKTLDDFIQLHNRNAFSQAIRAAVKLGIVQSLTESQKTVSQLANALNLQPAPLGRLMNVLVQTELVDRFGDDFALSTIGRLIPPQYLDFGDSFWQHLPAHIQTGDLDATQTDADYEHHKATEEWMLTPVALDVTQALDIGKSRRGLRILEIGAGSAVFAATMAHRDPDSVINLLDTVAGLERSKKTIDSIGLERQTVLIPAQRVLELAAVEELQDQEFDLVVLAGIVHRLPASQVQNLIAQIFPLVKKERELAIVDVFPGQEAGEINRAIFELELGLRTTGGILHDPNTLKAWLTTAGFRTVQYAHLPAPPHYWGLMVAEK
jgi:2-polyprenyl-3-methyl-5-hydroxy-6-metoxy-1,4-benzoquinol methylase